jgi:hypothetical protein
MREVKFISGYNCIDFPCKFENKCIPGNSHGKHGMEIGFYFHGEKGVVQFKLSTGWVPYYSKKSEIGVRTVKKDNLCNYFPQPTDLGYHSYVPLYKGQASMGACPFLGGKECYYDGSSLNSQDAFYVLVNCGEEALWKFLEGYYKSVFDGGEYPEVGEYGQ